MIAFSQPYTWTPAQLGASLLGWWDAERADLITQSSGAVSSWKDIVGAYDAVQATGASKPTYSATSFNGRPGVSFDGIATELTVSSYPATFPTGATAGEMWIATDQQAIGSDATFRTAVSLGNLTTGSRALGRNNSSSTSRVNIRNGDGATTQNSTVTTINFSGRHVARGIVNGTTIYGEIDTVRAAGTASVPATVGTRVRLGAGSAGSAASFWTGIHNSILITGSLTTTQASQLYGYLNRRL